ncbi:hypothetical protein BO71DRAFT_324401, partial [Aspergillus ellipticus CBS 707.79]
RTISSPTARSPFASVLLPYCLSASPMVLRAIQALAACHWSQHDPRYRVMGLTLKTRVLRDFRQRITTDQHFALKEDPEVVVVMMLLCLYEIVDHCDQRWIIHLQGAKDIIRLRRQRLTSYDPVSSFAELFFAFQDVMGRTACAKADLFGPRYWGENDTSINEWMGCSPALVSTLFSIMDLSRSRRSTDQSQFDAQASIVKRQLESLMQDPPTHSDDQVLPRIADLKKLTCTVYLHCALYNGGPSDPFVKAHVREILQGVLDLSAQGAVCNVMWPVFVAAVELDLLDAAVADPQTGALTYDRRLVLEMLTEMAKTSVSSVSRTRAVIEQVWLAPDLNASQTTSASGLNDWERYVVPVSDALSLV